MTPDTQTLTRTDIIDGLRDLVAALRTAGAPARVQIVGGAAIALSINADRPATVDIDAPLHPAGTVLAIATEIATTRGWRQDWLNNAAAAFVPNGFGTQTATWRTILDVGQIQVQVASPETLLAMKLHAAQRRGNRDAADLADLLPICRITEVRAAAAFYEAYYPGDSLTARTEQLLERLLAAGRPAPEAPELPSLG